MTSLNTFNPLAMWKQRRSSPEQKPSCLQLAMRPTHPHYTGRGMRSCHFQPHLKVTEPSLLPFEAVEGDLVKSLDFHCLKDPIAETPHMFAGHREINLGTDWETSSLVASFHSSRGCYANF